MVWRTIWVIFAASLAKILLWDWKYWKKTFVNRDGVFLRAIVFPTIFKCMLEHHYAIIKNFRVVNTDSNQLVLTVLLRLQHCKSISGLTYVAPVLFNFVKNLDQQLYQFLNTSEEHNHFLFYHFHNANRSCLTNNLNEIDSSFLNWIKISSLVPFYMVVINLVTKKPHHFNVHHKIHQRFSKIWWTTAIIIWVLMWNDYVYYICVYFRIDIMSFNIFSFSSTEIRHIDSRVLMYVF